VLRPHVTESVEEIEELDAFLARTPPPPRFDPRDTSNPPTVKVRTTRT